SNLITAVIALPFFLKGPAPDFTGWMSIGALGIFQTGLALVLFSGGIKKIRAITAMLIAALEPLLNPVWVFLFYGEKPGTWALIGGAIILTAVTLSSILSSAEDRRAGKPPVMPVPD
ncbi:MAG: DMT family transporter, partial [Spirochaetales bacterium]|nr:DMT family transporter [Spirochaetales bacterium]